MSTSNDIFKEVPGMGEISQLLYQRPCDALHIFPFRHDRPPAHGVLPADKVKPSSEGSSHPMTALLQGWGGGGEREMASKDLLWRTILPSEFLGGWLGLCSASPPRVFLSSPFHPFLSKGDNCKVYPQQSSSFLISKSQLSNWDTWKQWLWLLKLILKQEDF